VIINPQVSYFKAPIFLAQGALGLSIVFARGRENIGTRGLPQP
ncbi:uncharacterized protein METZ01_LOCUS369749, partial [marine metagenome]